MDDDEIHERYIDMVGRNWTEQQWLAILRTIRAHYYCKIWAADGSDGVKFTRLWTDNFSFYDEIRLVGEATLT